MNKIVRDHYPVEKLPPDLRQGLADRSTVRVVIEVESGFEAADTATSPQNLTIEDTLALVRAYRTEDRPSVSSAASVARIRALRDEWDD